MKKVDPEAAEQQAWNDLRLPADTPELLRHIHKLGFASGACYVTDCATDGFSKILDALHRAEKLPPYGL